MKALLEKKNSLIEELEGLVEKAKSEVRAFNKEEETKVESLKEEIRGLEKLISESEEVRTFDKKEIKVEGDKKVEVRNYNAEIRAAIESEKEIDVTNFEVEERKMGIGNQGGQIDKSVGNIKKTTFANQILKKAAESSDLYKYVRRENLGSALHQIPVQKTKITKFQSVAELAEYTAKDIDFATVQLAAHKFGNISVVSEEAISDLGYDIMAELVEQYGEAAGAMIDELLVKGNGEVQGLNSFINTGNGTAAVDAPNTKVTNITVQQLGQQDTVLEGLTKMYNALPRKYAKNATWVISGDLAGILNTFTDAMGRPLMTYDYSQSPFSGIATPMLFGRPVVITDEVNATNIAQNNPIAFFGDLSKAMIMGIRQNFTLKSSREYMWLRDGVAIKGTMRLDAKRGIDEAMSVLVKKN